ncbi:unnamed protein product, partial [Schistosoma mattheei]
IRSKHRSKNDNEYTNGYQKREINGSSATLQVPGMSYNPFENDGTLSEFSGPMGLPPMYQSHSNSPYAQSEFGGSLAGSIKSSLPIFLWELVFHEELDPMSSSLTNEIVSVNSW